MTEVDKLDLERAYRDAQAKAAALPNRLRDEYEQAEAENREPFPVTPLTAIRADLVLHCCEAIKGKASKELAAIVAVQKNACTPHGSDVVYLLSEQVAALLSAAGVSVPTKKEE